MYMYMYKYKYIYIHTYIASVDFIKLYKAPFGLGLHQERQKSSGGDAESRPQGAKTQQFFGETKAIFWDILGCPTVINI